MNYRRRALCMFWLNAFLLQYHIIYECSSASHKTYLEWWTKLPVLQISQSATRSVSSYWWYRIWRIRYFHLRFWRNICLFLLCHSSKRTKHPDWHSLFWQWWRSNNSLLRQRAWACLLHQPMRLRKWIDWIRWRQRKLHNCYLFRWRLICLLWSHLYIGHRSEKCIFLSNPR